MNLRILSALGMALVVALPCCGQESAPASPSGQQPGAGNCQRSNGGGGFGRGMMAQGNAVSGTVTEVAADHYTIKTEAGETYTVRLSANTRIIKQTAGMGGPGAGMGGPGEGQGGRQGQQQGQGSGQNQGAGAGPGEGPGQGQGGPGSGPPDQGQGSGSGQGQGQAQGQGQGQGQRGGFGQQLKATDIKVGDSLTVRGDLDEKKKTVSAQFVVQVDPQRAAEQSRQQAGFGSTWLAGKITAIDGVKVTLTGSADNAPHTFVADENTTFRRRREPVTLGDIENGDTVRVEGALKDGVFTATAVTLQTQQTAPTLPSGPGTGPQSGSGQPGESGQPGAPGPQ